MTYDVRIACICIAAVAAMSCGNNNETIEDAGVPTSDTAIATDMGNTDVGSSSPDSATVDQGGADDLGGTTDAGVQDAATTDLGEDAGQGPTLTEMEPNDGEAIAEVNALPIGGTISGNIDADDSDVFQIDTEPGKLYRAAIVVDRGSSLQPHLTVMDDGRGGDPAAGDYVKIMRGPDIDFLAMGEEGYYVVVRDARNVDGSGAGGAGHQYLVTVEEVPVADAVAGDVTFGTTMSGTLSGPGGVDLWTFDGTEGTEMVFDFATTGDLDGRLYVFAESEGSWVMRNDNRMAGNPDPLLDAPLFASGDMYLVVENIAEQATDTAYTIDASSN